MTDTRPSTERKPVTVLFADLAGSTELAVQRDAEQLRALLAAFFEEMAQQIRTFGGVVEKYAGDAIMAVFGVPRVHEDDAERAVRAAIAMRESLAQLNAAFEQDYEICLDLRVGIATGEAVAATEEIREFLVTGEVAHLAARLQSVAPGIVVSAETHRLLAPLLEAERLEALSLKGFTGPVTAYRVAGVGRLDSRPRGIPGLSSPVVGRDRETEALQRAVEDLDRGRGRILSLVGEAGIGKSRLKVELRQSLPERVRWLDGRCHAHTQTTGYAPFLQVLKALLQLSGAEPPAIARTKLRAGLRSLAGAQHDQAQAAVGHLLGIERPPGQPDGRPLDPRAFQTQLALAVRALFDALLARAPVVLALEDIHWADTASIELLTVLTELTDFGPLLILVTCRPETDGSAWDFRFHAQRNYPHRLAEIQLAALPPGETKRLAENLLHGSELPDGFQRWVLERSEGNPFFLEEIIRTLIEERVLRREGDRWTSHGDLDRVVIPSSLRGVIAARIDRLPALAKMALQHASVVGRFFTRRALQALRDGDGELDRALAMLLRAELIREWASLPEREYLFKHALTQEAAYASLLGEERRALHQKLAQWLEQTLPDAAGEHAPLLARHWLEADDRDRALDYTVRAARRAEKLYARPEAIAHYWQALDLLDRVPMTDERRDTHVAVVLALVQLPGWARDEAGGETGLRHLHQAMQAAAERGDVGSLCRLESLRGYVSGDETLLARAIARAETTGDALTQAFTGLSYGDYLGERSRYAASLTHVGRAIDLLGIQQATYDQALVMTSTGRCYSARAGKLEQALDYAARARRVAESLGDPRLLAWRAMESEPFMYQGRWAEVVRVTEESLPVAWEIREWSAILWSSAWLAIAYLKLGRVEDARRVVSRALGEAQEGAVGAYRLAYLQVARAQLCLRLGDLDDALSAGQKALELAERSHLRLEQGAAHRVLGEVLAVMGHRPEADAAFRSSLEVLDEIQSYPELAQTLLAYGRFKAPEDRAAGRKAIERALRLFEEMGATGWIEEARTAAHP